MFIVGSTALVGAFNNYRKGLVNFNTALLFGLTSIATVFLSRKWLIPSIPEHILTIGNFTVTKAVATMLLFAVLMLMASTAMIKGQATIVNVKQSSSLDYLKFAKFSAQCIHKTQGLLDYPNRNY